MTEFLLHDVLIGLVLLVLPAAGNYQSQSEVQEVTEVSTHVQSLINPTTGLEFTINEDASTTLQTATRPCIQTSASVTPFTLTAFPIIPTLTIKSSSATSSTLKQP